MASITYSPEAVEQLRLLIDTRAPVRDAYPRVRRSISFLAEFPRAGVELEGELSDLRSLLGPRRWMRIVYSYDEEGDRVEVVTFLDTREG